MWVGTVVGEAVGVGDGEEGCDGVLATVGNTEGDEVG